jgi:hypothetical protein
VLGSHEPHSDLDDRFGSDSGHGSFSKQSVNISTVPLAQASKRRKALPSASAGLQSNKIELVINHQSARMLGLTMPPTLIATANKMIE